MTNLTRRNGVTRTGWLVGIALLTTVSGCRSAALDRYTGRLPELVSLSFNREVVPVESADLHGSGQAQSEVRPDFEDKPDFEDGPADEFVELASSVVPDSTIALQPPVDTGTRESVAAKDSAELPSKDLLIPDGHVAEFESFPEDDSARQRAPLLPDTVGFEQATHSLPARLTENDDESREPSHLLDQVDGPIALFGVKPLELNQTDDVSAAESVDEVYREIPPEDPFLVAPPDFPAESVQEAGQFVDETQHQWIRNSRSRVLIFCSTPHCP